MPSTVTAPTNPRKVLLKAAQLGAHADCIAATNAADDHSKACIECQWIFFQSYDIFYGHLPVGEKLIAIMDDILRDRDE